MTTLTLPTVHSNGTSRNGLVSQLADASAAINEALTALSRTAPHMRDYYVKPDAAAAFSKAVAEHNARMWALTEVRNQLHQIYDAIDC
jgi:GR25 family glycosyltransferase involved in LPS biosynthesis